MARLLLENNNGIYHIKDLQKLLVEATQNGFDYVEFSTTIIEDRASPEVSINGDEDLLKINDKHRKNWFDIPVGIRTKILEDYKQQDTDNDYYMTVYIDEEEAIIKHII